MRFCNFMHLHAVIIEFDRFYHGTLSRRGADMRKAAVTQPPSH